MIQIQNPKSSNNYVSLADLLNYCYDCGIRREKEGGGGITFFFFFWGVETTKISKNVDFFFSSYKTHSRIKSPIFPNPDKIFPPSMEDPKPKRKT